MRRGIFSLTLLIISPYSVEHKFSFPSSSYSTSSVSLSFFTLRVTKSSTFACQVWLSSFPIAQCWGFFCKRRHKNECRSQSFADSTFVIVPKPISEFRCSSRLRCRELSNSVVPFTRALYFCSSSDSQRMIAIPSLSALLARRYLSQTRHLLTELWSTGSSHHLHHIKV